MNKVTATCFLFAFTVFLLPGCSTPVTRLIDLAQGRGLEVDQISTGAFDLLLVGNDVTVSRDAPEGKGVLRVYLEGDGSPWRHRIFVLPDPTPRYPLMLRLLDQDKHSAVYLGRPCYNGTFSDAGCDSSLWTSGRYSTEVVSSMATGLRAVLKRRRAEELWLIGHSGGGALAMLLAAEVPQVSRVVTIAANLDVDAWTDHHGYTPLFNSGNPATMAPLRQSVWQWHLVGSLDTNIPPQLTKPFILSQKNATGIEFSRFNHGCCWENIWPLVLRALEGGRPKVLSGKLFKRRAESPET